MFLGHTQIFPAVMCCPQLPAGVKIPKFEKLQDSKGTENKMNLTGEAGRLSLPALLRLCLAHARALTAAAPKAQCQLRPLC